MGGAIDWAALPVLIEYYGLDDPDAIIAALLTIKGVGDRERAAAAKRR